MVRLDPLLRLSALLDIGADDLRQAEEIDVLAETFEVSSQAVARLDDKVVSEVVREYGTALQLTIGTGALDEFTLQHGVLDTPALRVLTEEAGTINAKYDLSLRIDKQQLIDHVIGSPGDAAIRIFFFESVLAKVLAQPPADIERRLWQDPTRRLVVLVLDTELRITGDCLSILGAEEESALQDESRRPIPRDLNRTAARRNDYIGWDSTLATTLTPRHFHIIDDGQVSSELANRLRLLAIGVGAMYLSDRCRHVQRPGEPSHTVAEFRGREHVAFIPVDWLAEPPTTIDARQADAVLAVAAWSYERLPEYPSDDMVADRLPFVQTRLAQLLEGRPEGDRLAAFASVMPAVNEGVRWHWRSFIEGRVVEYLEQVRELEAAVTETVTALTNRTSALVKRLSETSLAAVAALIGSFIAAAFNDPFQADLFRVGMLAYAAYILIFPLAIGVASTTGDVRVALKTFGTQRKNLANVLGEERVDELIASRPQEAQSRFAHWRQIVSVLYLVAAAATVAAAIAVPKLMGTDGVTDDANDAQAITVVYA
jgi:hypothetical protein